MPIYVYERPDGSRFELRQGFNDDALTEDPEMGVPVRRIMQPAPIIFKGSGWYKTDSRVTAASKAEGATETPAAEKKTEGGDTAAKGDKAEKAEKSEKSEKSDTAAAPAAKTDATPTKPSAEGKKAADKIAAAS